MQKKDSVTLIKVFEFYSFIFVLSYFSWFTDFPQWFNHNGWKMPREICFEQKCYLFQEDYFSVESKALNSKSYKIKNAGQKIFPEKKSHRDFSSTR